MVKKYICSFCGCELEALYHVCPKCDHENCVGWFDEIDGYHEGGTGTMPDGTECGECSRESCNECVAWRGHQTQQRQYGTWHCQECGNELEIWLDTAEAKDAHFVMWHCTECGCDYESCWTREDGVISFERKLWG